MEVILDVLSRLVPIAAIVAAAFIIRRLSRRSNKKNKPNSAQSQPVNQSSPVTTNNHEAAPDAAPATDSTEKAMPKKVAVKAVPVKQSNRRGM